MGWQPRRESTKTRVIQTLRSGRPKRPSLRNTSQKEVETGRNNNVPKGSQQQGVFSALSHKEVIPTKRRKVITLRPEVMNQNCSSNYYVGFWM